MDRRLTALRYAALLVVITAMVVSVSSGLFGIGIVFATTLLILVMFMWADVEDIQFDLVRHALLLKMLSKGNSVAAVSSWCVAVYVFLIQVAHGRLRLDPIEAFLFSAVYAFYLGAVYYLVFRWQKDIRCLEAMNETQLIYEARHEKKSMRSFNVVNFPWRFITG